MGKIKLGLLLLLMTLVGTPMTGYGMQLSESELYARSACLMDADSGRVLYSKNSEQKLPMASTTKIMTCILALEDGRMDDLVTVSAYAASQPKVHMGAKTGEQFYLQDLLYALMLNSDNDAAVMIAEQVGGSVEGFAEKMNLKARELGCDDTYFITPNGLDAENKNGIHSTTAKDLARILRYCIMESPKKAEFLAITQMPAYTFWNYSKTQIYQCTNHNAFLGMMDGALTGKTGFTGNAGYCLCFSMKTYKGNNESDCDNRLIGVVLGTNHKNKRTQASMSLLKYGKENFSTKNIIHKDELIGKKYIYGISDMEVCLKAQNDLYIICKPNEEIKSEVTLKEINYPVKKGDSLGVIKYYNSDGIELGRLDVISENDLDQITFKNKMKIFLKEHGFKN